MEDANREMTRIANQDRITWTEAEACLEQHKLFPAEASRGRDALRARQALLKNTMADDLNKMVNEQSSDVRAIDAVLEANSEYNELLKEPLEMLKAHRDTLLKLMHTKLAEGKGLPDPLSMGEILTEAEQFKPEEVEKEVAALVEARVALFKKAGDDMGALKDSEDFGAVRDAVAKFSKWEASEIATALQALEQQRDSMVDAAKSELNDLGSSQDPLAITTALPKFDIYGEAVAEAKRSAESRRAVLFGDAVRAMTTASEDSNLSMGAMQALLKQYEEYPVTEVGRARKALQTSLSQAASQAADRAQGLSDSTNVKLIEAALEKYNADEPGDLAQAARDDLSARRDVLVKEIQTKLQEACSYESPKKCDAVLDEATDFGAAAEDDVKKTKEHRDKLVSDANEAMKSLASSSEADLAKLFEEVDAAMEKYVDFPLEEVTQNWGELSLKRDELVSKAKQTCVDLCNSEDPAAILEELEKLKPYGKRIEDQRVQVRGHCNAILKKAVRSMRACAMDNDATIARVEELLETYKDYPAQGGIDGARIQLQAALERAAKKAGTAMRDQAASTDVVAIDALLAKYEAHPDHAAESLKALQEQRTKLADDMKEKLKAGLEAKEPRIVAELVKDAGVYGESVQSEREALEKHSVQLFEDANKKMEELASGKYEGELHDYEQVCAALKDFDDWPSADVGEARSKLLEHRKGLEKAAKDEMLKLIESIDPVAIEEEAKKYEVFGASVANQRAAVKQRLEMLCETASSKFDKLARDQNGTLQAIAAMLVEFDAYPKALIASARDKLISRQVLLITRAKEALVALAESQDVAKVDAQLKSLEGIEDERIKEQLAALSEHRATMLADMKAKLGADVTSPGEARELLKLSEPWSASPFGDEVKDEVASLSNKRKSLCEDASKAMKDLAANKDSGFKEAHECLAQYAGAEWQEDDMKVARAELTTFREKLVDGAKLKLLELCGLSDPVKIAEELTAFTDYGDAVATQAKAAANRRAELIRGAINDMRRVAESAGSTLQQLNDVKDRYKAYAPEDIDAGLELVANALKIKSTTASSRMAALMEATDAVGEMAQVRAIDDMLRDHADSGESVEKALEDLKAFRGTLETAMMDKLKAALTELEHPNKVRALIEQGSVFGENVKDHITELEQHRAELLTKANGEMKELSASDDYVKVEDCLKLYDDWPEEVSQQRALLAERRGELVAAAKQRLLSVCASNDIGEVQKVLVESECFAENVRIERRALKSTEKKLIDEAKHAMSSLAAKSSAAPLEIKMLLERYTPYAAMTEREMDDLRAKLALTIQERKDALLQLMTEPDVRIIDEELAAPFEGCEEEVEEALKQLREYRATLEATMRGRLGDVDKIEDSMELFALLAQADAFGESLKSESRPVRDKLDGIVRTVKAELEGLRGSDDYLAIIEAIEKHVGGTAEMEAARGALRVHAEQLVDDAKTSLLAMCKSEDARTITAELDRCDIRSRIATCHHKKLVAEEP